MSVRLVQVFLLLECSLVGWAGEEPPSESLTQRWAAVVQGKIPHQSAWGLYGGRSYDWVDLGFGLVSYQHLYDYEDIWLHQAPKGLGVRFEGTLGGASGPTFSGARLMTSCSVLAVYEFGTLEPKRNQFYAEAGIGLIYTDMQRPGQGSRINFNPVAGIGWRLGRTYLTLRLHHISNAGLHRENQGINSALLGIGRYFN